MKLISEHLGEIIVALAGVALLVAAIALFDGQVGNFFAKITESLTSLGSQILDGMSYQAPSL